MILLTDPRAFTAFTNAAVIKFKSIQDDLVAEIKHEMEITPRDTSKAYWVNINGTWQIHNPSFPNEYPAVMSGNLRNAVSSDVKSRANTAYLRFGVLPGTSDSDGIGYAFMLEVGTDVMAPRPWLTYGKHIAKRMLL
jgi:hypothetical protein